MADPLTLSIMAGVSMAGSAASGIMGAAGASAKADAQTAMYNYKAGVAKANQQVAAQNKAYAIQAGGVRAEQEGLKGAQMMGATKVAQAGSGFDVNTGTAVGVRDSQQAAITQTQGLIRNDAARKAYGYDVEGMGFAAESKFDVMAGEAAQTAGGWDVASSLLGGATQVADKWSKFKNAGVSSFA